MIIKDKDKDGKREGKWTEWYKFGQKRVEGNYKDGKKEGKWIWLYNHGQVEENYKDGELVD